MKPATTALLSILFAGASSTIADAASLLPGMLFEINPALPASTAPLGSAPGIQIDGQGGIVAMRLSALGSGSGQAPGQGILIRGGSGHSTLVDKGLDGRPVISNPSGASGGWDSLVLDPAVADAIVGQHGQPFTLAVVERRRAITSCDIMKLYARKGTHVHLSPTAKGTILIGQNDGPGIATEEAPEPLNQWDILYYVYDGRYGWLLRNGVRTAATPAFAGGGFGPGGVQTLEFLNGCAMDVAWLGVATQAPSAAQINAESARLRTMFRSITAQTPLEAGSLVDVPSPSPTQGDLQGALATVNQPLAEPLPVIANAEPGHGLMMKAGSHVAFSLRMGSAQRGANMTTAQSIRDRFFLNYMEGDLNRAIGSPMDTGQSSNETFAAVARHYPPGDPRDLHVMEADGMHLRAVCARGQDCSPGHVLAGMVRLPFEWRPGMTLKVRYRSPKGDHSWAPIWMFTGQQTSPGPAKNPYQGFGKPDALYRASSVNFEIDWNDNYSRARAGVPTGYQIDFGVPNIYGTHWNIKPHGVFWANTNGWRYYDLTNNPEFERTPFDWSAGFHDLIGNWRGDGSNLLDLIVDGTLVSTMYMEYPQKTYTDPATGQRKTIAMHLIIGNQAVPAFSRDTGPIRDNDGIPDGWTVVIQEISGWYGNIADPDRYRPSPDRTR